MATPAEAIPHPWAETKNKGQHAEDETGRQAAEVLLSYQINQSQNHRRTALLGGGDTSTLFL